MRRIEYERNWCEYFTECPFHQTEADGTPIMVGSYECAVLCPHHGKDETTNDSHYMQCKFEEVAGSHMTYTELDRRYQATKRKLERAEEAIRIRDGIINKLRNENRQLQYKNYLEDKK